MENPVEELIAKIRNLADVSISPDQLVESGDLTMFLENVMEVMANLDDPSYKPWLNAYHANPTTITISFTENGFAMTLANAPESGTGVVVDYNEFDAFQLACVEQGLRV